MKEELIKNVLKRLVDITFNDREDRPLIDQESTYELLNLLSLDTIGDIYADLYDNN